MIGDTTELRKGHQYKFRNQILTYSHKSQLSRGAGAFSFRTVKGNWKVLSRNQLNEVSPIDTVMVDTSKLEAFHE